MNKRLVICYTFFWTLYLIFGKVLTRCLKVAAAPACSSLTRLLPHSVLVNHTVRTLRRKILAALLGSMLGIAPLASAAAEYGKPADLTGLPLDQLLNIEVYTASKFPQKTTEAPASVSVITAADIKGYGYRTLADILRSVRGMNTTYDRNYAYLGIRGIGRLGDYNSRMLLLVDGYRINDNIFDTAAIGTEFLLDVDLIDRVEIVRGPGSSIYGSNAVLGVINVITKRGKDLGGLQASGELASFGTGKERLSYGRQYDNGAELLLSATNYHSTGQDLFFPEFNTPATNNGIAQHLDGDRDHSIFGKLAYHGFTLTSGYSRREKAVPTASFGTVFNDPNFVVTDGAAFVDLGYYGEISTRWNIATHVFQGQYRYDGVYPYAALNKDIALGAWRGGEVKLDGQFEKNRLIIGAEYQDNFRQDQLNYDIAPYLLVLDDRRSSNREGVYIQDEMKVGNNLLFNAGLRYDRYSSVGVTFNPRLGLIWTPAATTDFKLLYGTAFRAPNVFESYYVVAGQKANPALKPEKIRTYELVIEHRLQPNFRITADAYSNKISNNINQITDPADGLLVYVNAGQVDSHGLEFEAERWWNSGARLRASYAWQSSRDKATNAEQVNSPRSLAKLNCSVPVWGDKLRTAAELQYTSSRKTLTDARVNGHLLANLTLLSEKVAPGLELSATIYNLFDTRYADPAAQEHAANMMDTIMQDGRGFRLKASYRF